MLVGNGLSIAFNPDLNLQAITTEVMNRIGGASGDDAAALTAMRSLAEHALPDGADSDGDFEKLVGVFGSERRNLGHLHDLAEALTPDDADLRDSIVKTAEFAEYVSDFGISLVLEVIFERSRAREDRIQSLRELVIGVAESFEHTISIANLNYDSLLLAALLSTLREQLADLGHGWKTAKLKSTDGPDVSVPRLRDTGDFPDSRRIRLLSLHGSLTYWHSPRQSDLHVKLDMSHLEGSGAWEAIRTRTTPLRPSVVLATQRDKSEHVRHYPFSLAYEEFAKALTSADDWLIIGYSFRDECVNDLLRDEFLSRAAERKPRVLVATFGNNPSREDVARAHGWGAEDGESTWLTFHRGGAATLLESPEWSAFVSSPDQDRCPTVRQAPAMPVGTGASAGT